MLAATLPVQPQPVSWTSNPPQSAPRIPSVPWLGEEGEMQPEVQTGLRATAFRLDEMGENELE